MAAPGFYPDRTDRAGRPAIQGARVFRAGKPFSFPAARTLALETPGVREIVTRRTTYLLAGQPIAIRNVEYEDGILQFDERVLVYTDHLGSANTIMDTGGTVVESRRFYPFGEYREGTTSDVTDRGFTGHMHNDSIGLVYMNARWHSPSANRFLTPDPIVPDPANRKASTATATF